MRLSIIAVTLVLLGGPSPLDGQAVKVQIRPRNFWCNLPCPKNTEHTMCAYTEDDSTPYCWDTVYKMNLKKREAILDWHNELRDFVAGLKAITTITSATLQTQSLTSHVCALGGGLGKKASNMQALTWDFELEQVARRWTFQCKRSKDACRTTEHYSHDNISQNIGWVTNDIDRELQPTKAILESWNQTKDQFFDPQTKEYRNYLSLRTPNALLNDFIQMTKACLEKVGCGEVIYVQGQARRRFLACNYAPSLCREHNPSDEFVSRLFKVGTPCSACPPTTDCHFFDTGYKHLCQRHHGSGKKPVLRHPQDSVGNERRSSIGPVICIIFGYIVLFV